MAFAPATKKNARMRLAISGVSGAGKTYSSLLLAKEFGSKIAVLDSERGSASLYADLVPFDVDELENHSVSAYIDKINEAAAAGYEVLVIDSFSHSWMSAMGAIDRGGGWKAAGKVISPMLDRLVTTILTYPGHVIATLRSKTDYAYEQNDKGKVVPRKVGLAPVARPDAEYDFTVWLEVHREGHITVQKTRCSTIDGETFDRVSDLPRIGKILREWLSAGAPVSPVQQLQERIRFAKDQAALDVVISEVRALKGTPEFEAVTKTWRTRKEELETEASGL